MAERTHCQFWVDGLGTGCRWCGCWSRYGEPTCPPYITRDEPDGTRLPHIKTRQQNNAIHQAWMEKNQ